MKKLKEFEIFADNLNKAAKEIERKLDLLSLIKKKKKSLPIPLPLLHTTIINEPLMSKMSNQRTLSSLAV